MTRTLLALAFGAWFPAAAMHPVSRWRRWSAAAQAWLDRKVNPPC